MGPKEPKDGRPEPLLPLVLAAPFAGPGAADVEAVDPATEAAADEVEKTLEEPWAARVLDGRASLSKPRLEKEVAMVLGSLSSSPTLSRNGDVYRNALALASEAVPLVALERLFE